MRKTLLTITVVAILALTGPVFSADISFGGATWYSWWEFEQGDYKSDYAPTFLYGPVVSVSFAKRYSISSVFLLGKFESNNQSEEGEPGKIDRYDSDTSLNYNINRYIKIFGGLKYMAYSFADGAHYGFGPALGFGITLPIGSNFYLLGNFSGVHNFGRHREVHGSEGTYKSPMRELGFNSTLSLAYYIEAASITISLGGRYQYFHIYFESDRIEELDMHFYGVTLSVIYSFGI